MRWYSDEEFDDKQSPLKGMLAELFDVERRHSGMSRRVGINDRIAEVVEKNWMSREEAIAYQEPSQKP